MIIPYEKLSPEALRGVIEETVTRDGTELTDAEEKIAQVMRLLRQRKVVITYDLASRTCNLMPAAQVRDEAPAPEAGEAAADRPVAPDAALGGPGAE